VADAPLAQRPAEDGTAANERLTATTATVLLVLLAVEGFTILRLHQLLSVHIVVGVLLSVHVLVYAPRLPRAVLSRRSHAGARLGVVAGSLLAGAVLAAASYSLTRPWLHRRHHEGREGAATYLSVFR